MSEDVHESTESRDALQQEGWRIKGPCTKAGDAVRHVLTALPDWFGIPSAIEEYAEKADKWPTWLLLRGDEAIGIMIVCHHFATSAEIYCMGILASHHGQGWGRKMIQTAESWLQTQGVRWLQVKTLSSSHSSEHYARTRLFYQAMGFEPLEEFPELWGSNNPCLMLIKQLHLRED